MLFRGKCAMIWIALIPPQIDCMFTFKNDDTKILSKVAVLASISMSPSLDSRSFSAFGSDYGGNMILNSVLSCIGSH